MFSLEDEIKCIEREIKMRERVYPILVQKNRMKHNSMLYEIDCMKSVLKTLKSLLGEQKKLF